MAGIDYAPLAVAHFGFDRTAFGAALDGMGFLAPRDEGRTLLGCQWTSSVFGDRAPPGKVLLSAYLGGARASHIASWGEAEDRRRRAARADAGAAPARHARAGARGAAPARPAAVPRRPSAARAALNARAADAAAGLHLAANYLDGVSTRDRITSGCAIARAVCSHLRGALARGRRGRRHAQQRVATA
ncbi:MAG: hypothetical protein HS128_07210 [Ideonella sp.]|nr:hypothetical protein [Ideonella sp.]